MLEKETRQVRCLALPSLFPLRAIPLIHPSKKQPPHPIPKLLAELHETYRGLYSHLPPTLRPPGMTLLEAADAWGPRRGGVPPSASSSSSFLPPLVTLRWASRAMRGGLMALLDRADQASGCVGFGSI